MNAAKDPTLVMSQQHATTLMEVTTVNAKMASLAME